MACITMDIHYRLHCKVQVLQQQHEKLFINIKYQFATCYITFSHTYSVVLHYSSCKGYAHRASIGQLQLSFGTTFPPKLLIALSNWSRMLDDYLSNPTINIILENQKQYFQLFFSRLFNQLNCPKWYNQSKQAPLNVFVFG